jgi:hypothetical protein
MFTIAMPLTAQDPRQMAGSFELATLTTDQMWARSSFLSISALTSLVALGKSRGMTADEVGRWLGDLYAPSWGPPNTGSALRVARIEILNWKGFPGMTVEILSASDTSATMRMSRPWTASFNAPDQRFNGVSLEEYERSLEQVQARINQYLGLRSSQKTDSSGTTMTITGRGSAAIMAFPRGTYSTTLTAADLPTAPQLAGTWENTYASDGTFTVRHNGEVALTGRIEVALDQVVFHSETGPQANCTGPGKYRWTVNPTTGNLAFGKLSDDCDGRFRILTRRSHVKK